jgi:hypothetical protein
LIGKVFLAFAAAAAVAAASGVLVVALAFTLFAAVRDVAGPAWGSASVAGAAALLLVIAAAVLALKAGVKKKKQATVPEKLAAFVRERPVVAGAAALAAGLFAARNPKMLMAVLLAFLEPKAGRKS